MFISNAFGKLDNSLLLIENSINGDTGFLSYLESIQQNMITNNTFNKFSSELFKFLKKNVEDVQTHFIHNFLTENFNIQNTSFSQFILNNFQEVLSAISSINPHITNSVSKFTNETFQIALNSLESKITSFMESNLTSLSTLYNFLTHNFEIPNSSFSQFVANNFQEILTAIASINLSITGEEGFATLITFNIENIRHNKLSSKSFNSFSTNIFNLLNTIFGKVNSALDMLTTSFTNLINPIQDLVSLKVFNNTSNNILPSISNTLTNEEFNSSIQLNVANVLSPMINKRINYLHPTLDEILSLTSSLQQNLIDENGFIPLLTHNLDFILQNILTFSTFDESIENLKLLIISNFEKIIPSILNINESLNTITPQIENSFNRVSNKLLTFDTLIIIIMLHGMLSNLFPQKLMLIHFHQASQN
jgi:hypothetical protein